MPVATVSSLVDSLRVLRLLEPQRLEQVRRSSAQFPDPRALAKDLIQRGWLTAFQVNQLLQDRGQELVLGQYLLLERLGEGGMGQVFKARHTSLDRIVALKLLRKELMARPDAARRFLREIRLVAQLAHPNIVLAFDADKANDITYLAMEYVEGTDLGQLVKQKGPLAIRMACDCIRQAALGLQHAHERGLIHRDIKPSNLLLAKAGNVVKVVDLGLARLSEAEDESISSSVSAPDGTQLTCAGKVMGTPDFIAPEQARNSHDVDIRADLYSLGCTFYFLLVGYPPFAGTTALEKLIKHQMEPPPDLQKLRPEVPAAVVAIVKQLMAKQPAQRFQTPGQLAAVLEPRESRESASGPATLRISKNQVKRRTSVQVAGGTGRAPLPAIPTAAPVAVAVPIAAEPQWNFAGQEPAPAAGLFERGSSWAMLAWLGVLLLLVSGTLLALTRLPALAHLFDRKPRADTATATEPAPRGPNRVFLTDLPEKDVTVGRGTFGKNGDLGYDGRRIAVKGKDSPHGLSMHPPPVGQSTASYALEHQYQWFEATAALNDKGASDGGGNARSPIIFKVLGDGKELFKSKQLRQLGDSENCKVSVAGVERLQLVVECVNARNDRAYAVWLEPQLFHEAPRGAAPGP